MVVTLFLAQKLLQTDDKRQDEGDLANDECLSGQEEQHTQSDGYQRRHFHGHSHHHHAHHLLHLASAFLHAPLQLARARSGQTDLDVEAVQQRGDSVEQDLGQDLVLTDRVPAQTGLQLGESALGSLVGGPNQLEVLGQRQSTHPAESLEERDRLLLQARRHCYVALLAILVHAVHRPEAFIQHAVVLLRRRGRASNRTARQQDQHTLGQRHDCPEEIPLRRLHR